MVSFSPIKHIHVHCLKSSATMFQFQLLRMNMINQMYISRWSLPHTTSARRVTTSLSSPPLPKTKRTTISSWSQVLSASGLSKRNSWARRSHCMSHWRTAARTTSIFRRVTMPPAISKQQLVSKFSICTYMYQILQKALPELIGKILQMT